MSINKAKKRFNRAMSRKCRYFNKTLIDCQDCLGPGIEYQFNKREFTFKRRPDEKVPDPTAAAGIYRSMK